MELKVIIRKGRPADVTAMKELWKQFIDLHRKGDRHFTRSKIGHARFGKFALKMMRDRSSLVLVAEQQGRIVGYLTARIDNYPPVYVEKRFGAIYDIMVVPMERHQGLGRQLFLKAQQWFRKKGMKRIELMVSTTNPLAGRFWNKMGFKTYMERKFIRC